MGVLRVWLGLATLAVSVNAQADVFGVDPISPSVCLAHQATCSDGSCIAKARVCDGSRDCPDASDENGCGDAHRCQPNEFRCSFNNTKCVQKDWRCDGDDDCGDNSDEADCDAGPPGSECSYVEFQCETGGQFGAQCIPRSFHCDGQADCQDQSDEVGCSAPIFVSAMPATLYVRQGDVFVLNCKAMGIPTPEVIWRLNWGHVPDKCNQISEGGEGTLSCPEAVPSDQGAYSCEAMNIKGSRFAVPDTVVIVSGGSGICQPPDFNTAALSNDDCQRCFCFGATTDCYSSSLFAETMTPARPNEIELRTVARISPELVVEPPSRDSSRMLRVGARGEVTVTVTDSAGRGGTHYFSLPPSYRGPHLGSYGGYIRYILDTASQSGRDRLPDVILSGNDITIWHRSDIPQSGLINLKIAEGTFDRYNPFDEQVPASREDIMMVLQDIDLFLIAVPRSSNGFQGTLNTVQLDTAIAEQSLQGTASLVEECRCPTGYKGMSCEDCAPGYERQSTSQWLGRCVEQQKRCPSGEYGDPQRGIACQPCQCPGSSNQYGQTCRLDTDDQVTCDCLPGYMGRRCGRCTPGYRGNPAAGEPCTAGGECDAAGSMEDDPDPATGRCRCKAFATGSKCDRCKARAFFLHEENRHGCINCFCMGVTDQCRSSSWYRSMIRSVFTNHDQGFYLSVGVTGDVIDGGFVDGDSRELTYGDIPYTDRQPIYWMFPALYLSNKITSYGGDLRFVLHYDSQSRTTQTSTEAPDIEIFGNDIRLQHRVPTGVSSGRLVPVSVPFYEQYWRRDDGNPADREHLLMALANLEYIAVKATHGDNTQRVALSNVSMDTATARNNGVQRAHAVEQCSCPTGYKGLSCENCDVGYTRSLSGLYLRHCELCECNGHSEQCDPEVGECLDCRDNTYGANCERCAPGYIGDPQQGQLCRPDSSRSCQCDPRGSTGRSCDSRRQCPCKTGAAGPNCDRCRPGYFALMAQNREGCMRCFCSGVSQQCSEANVYRTQTQMQLIDEQHEFTLSNRFRNYIVPGDRFSLNTADNEIGFNQFAQEQPNGLVDILYWSLPPKFLGNQLRSYDGKLKVRQRFDQRLSANPLEGFDIILSGNGITLTWNNPSPLQPGRMNSYEVALSEEAGWTFTDNTRNIQRAATREELMQVLSGIGSILIRAVMSDAMRATYLSNVAIDTAIYTDDRQGVARGLEQCRCPTGYIGLSCEDCAPGHYRVSSEPFSSCRKCPCSDNEETCFLRGSEVTCRCKPGFVGPYCRDDDKDSSITVTIIEPLIVIRAGETATFRCSGESRTEPQVEIRWLRPNGPLSDRAVDDGRGTLVIRGVTSDDSGVYICEVRDSVSTNTRETQLNVGGDAVRTGGATFDAPSATISPPWLDLTVGAPAQLECTASGAPSQIKWSRRRGPIHPDVSLIDGFLVIGAVRKYHEDEYECTVRNADGSDTSRAIIYVREPEGGSGATVPPPPTPQPPVRRGEVTPQEMSVRPGDLVQIRCTTEDVNSQIVWSKEQGQLSERCSQSDGTLVIRDLQPNDGGVYVCTITSVTGQRERHTARIDVMPGQRLQLPTARVDPSSQSVPQGTSFQLSCFTSGVPTPAVSWRKSRGELPSRAVVRGDRLTISDARTSDRGHYICQSENSEGVTVGYGTVEVEPREPPVIQIHPRQDVKTTVGSPVFFQCLVTGGTPAPTVSWSRADGAVLPGTAQIQPGGLLRFAELRGDEAGSYECTATNPAGVVKRRIRLELEAPPSVTLNHQSPHRVQEGERVVLECLGSGDPLPSMSWTRQDGLPLPYVESSGPQQLTRRLVFESVSFEDAGEYVCQASSRIGQQQQRLRLDVERSPSEPYLRPNGGPFNGNQPFLQPNRVPLNGNQPFLQPNRVPPNGNQPYSQQYRVPLNGNAELRCYFPDMDQSVRVVWTRSDGRPLPENHQLQDGTLFIYNVQKDAEGLYSCSGFAANSEVVLSTDVQAYLVVVEPPHIQLNPKKQVVRPGDNVYIYCTATGDQPIQLNWSKVDGQLPRSVSIRDGELNFRRIAVSDAGRYLCVAKNSVAHAEGIAEVVVHDGASIVAVDSDVVTTEGMSVELRCQSSGTQARVTWRRDAGYMPRSAVVRGSSVRIPYAKQSASGQYICEAEDGTGHVVRDSVRLTVQPVGGVTARIRSSPTDGPVREGDTIDLTCEVTGAPDSRITWDRLEGRMLGNALARGPLLRLHKLQSDNEGVYRCTIRTSSGQTYTEEHVLSVTARDPPAGSNLRRRDARPEIVRAQLGYPGILSCRSPLNSPYTTYSWTKTDYPLAQPITTNQAELRFDAVRLRDAGSYVCRSSDGRGDVDSVSYLLVTDVVPSFSQQANSYAQLDTIPDAYLGFDMELSFRPQLYDGLILYNGQNPSGGETRGDRSGRDATDGDFVSFGLSDGYPELRFSMNGQRSTVVRSRRHVTPGQWHSVRLRRHGARGKMVLDGEEVAEAAGEDDHVKMDLTEPLYIGGVPDFTAVHPDNGFKIGYSGCISRLSVSGVTYNISGGDVTVGRGLDVCDVCGSEGALCDNGAQCQEAFSPHGHRCLCTDNYTGETCSAPGYSCSPDSCGSGRCVNEDGGFRCLCPFGKIGDQCEEDVLITEPSFDGDGYMTFGTPRAIRRLEFELRLKPDKLEDGLVFYAAGNEHSQGDFAALVIKNEHIEFRYNDGLGVGTLRSPSPLQQGEWIHISGSREASNTTLRVNNGDLLESQSTVRTRGLNLRTPLYLGGTDPLRMRPDPAAVGVRRGFSGCVTSLRVGGTEVSLLRAHTGAANVRQCPQVDRPCARRPCQHGARCRDTGPQSADYVCSCTPGYTGVNCQLIVDPCLTHNPCENGGVCSSSATGRVHCGCLLGFFGEHCQKEAVLEGSVAFDGHSYVELPPSLKSHSGNKHVQESQTVQIRFNTEYDGLLFYHGQTPQDDGSDKDYVALAVRQGRPEMSFQLGSGPVRITLPVRVDDGRTHTLRMQRTGRDGLLQLDDGQRYSREGSAPGVLTMLNTKGNIYLGGVPEYARMTGDRFSTGFSGCIHELRIQDVQVSFVNSALSAINVSPCQQVEEMAIPDVLPDVMPPGISNSRYDVVDYPDSNLLYRRTELRENGGPSTGSPYSDDLYDDYGDLEIYDNDEYYDVDSWSNE